MRGVGVSLISRAVFGPCIRPDSPDIKHLDECLREIPVQILNLSPFLHAFSVLSLPTVPPAGFGLLEHLDVLPFCEAQKGRRLFSRV